MQSINWYVKRTKLMSRQEIYWRIKSLFASWVEQTRVRVNLVPKVEFKPGFDVMDNFEPGFRVFSGNISDFDIDWVEPLVSDADKILDNKLSYFDLNDCDLETPINWHKDHSAQINSSVAAMNRINYRDFNRNGDCKLVWEPNRHHQIVILARAYKVTGQLKYAQGVVSQISSWLDANPYGYGMNWRSPLELSIRMINWVWALDLILDSQLFVGEFKQRVLESVYLHCRDVSGKFSQGTSANNHLVGEAAGVYIASSYFPMLSGAKYWQAKSKHILEREIQAQTFNDGCTKEHAFSYQFFVFQFYLLVGLTGKWQGTHFDESYWKTLHRLMQFVCTIAQGGSQFPMLGDQDDGYVLNLGNSIHDIPTLAAIGLTLFADESDIYHSLVHKNTETNYWLFNQRETPVSTRLVIGNRLQSKAFTDSGYYLLQACSQVKTNQASVLIDCADLGYTAIAAHGHADALSMVVRINKMDFLVDTGTYDYFTYPKWRNYFRSTRAHNTVEIDGLDQSTMTGPFMWEQHAKAQCISWDESEVGGAIEMMHTGYQRLADSVIHHRKVSLDINDSVIVIQDKLEMNNEHDIAIHFHLSEHCREVKLKGNHCLLLLGNQEINMILPDALSASLIKGDINNIDPSLGWLSRGYHHKEPINTLKLAGTANADISFETRICW